MDTRFELHTIASIPNPNQVVWQAMHQDYSHKLVCVGDILDERKAGEAIVNHLLKGGRGHYGCFEHPQIILNAGYINHATMQQLRTHRMGISFDVQSFRYTSKGLLAVADGDADIEDVIYFRPIGDYTDRKGNRYMYGYRDREADIAIARILINRYACKKRLDGMSEEHCRGLLPFDYRQHFVMSVNARSLMHLLDLRAKADAEIECQEFCKLLLQKFTDWMPEVAQWYLDNRWSKARLAP